MRDSGRASDSVAVEEVGGLRYVGQPPVAVRAIAAAARGAKERISAGQEGFGLTRAQVEAALAEPEPAPPWPSATGIGLILSLAGLWAAHGLAALGSALIVLLRKAPAADAASDPAASLGLLGAGLLIGVGLIALGTAAGLAAWASAGRWAALGLGGLVLSLSLAFPQGDRIAWSQLALGLGSLLLFLPGLSRWFEPAGAACARALPPLGPRMLAFGLSLLSCSFQALPAFREVFDSMGVALPAPTRLLLYLSELCSPLPLLLPFGASLGIAALLRLPPERERAALGAGALGLAAGLLGPLAILWPIYELQRALAQ